MRQDDKSPNDKADLVEQRLKQLNVAVDILEETGLLDIFKKRLGGVTGSGCR